MTNQIFKRAVPNHLLFELCEKMCLKTDKYFLIDNNAYKKLLYNNWHEPFLSSLKEYYHLGKHHYLERKLTYNAFTTIVRQICKHNSVLFTSQIKYNKSNYNIDYLVYF